MEEKAIMKNDNYKFILADDHKGNKALTIVKGNLKKELVTSISKIDDPAFSANANELIKILNQTTVKKGGKE